VILLVGKGIPFPEMKGYTGLLPVKDGIPFPEIKGYTGYCP